MSQTMDQSMRPRTSSSGTSPPAGRLRHQFAAIRVSFTWLGVRKSLNADQKSLAAEQFGAEGQFLSAAEKLLDTRHQAFQAVSSIRSKIISDWKSNSLPYPEPGTRLIRYEDVETFNDRMLSCRDELEAAVVNLDQHFEQLKEMARGRLGSLYNDRDYPQSHRGLFTVEWDFPSIEPPEYLLQLNPRLFDQERARMSQRFDEAIRMAEEAFIAEFSGLVNHLAERLANSPDGDRKVFRDSAIGNLNSFFERFKNLNVRSNSELDRLVEIAQQSLSGVSAQGVRNSMSLRQQVSSQLASVQATLDQMLVDQPRRRILRRTPVSVSEHREG